jgi:hypothetical protein
VKQNVFQFQFASKKLRGIENSSWKY